MKKTLLFAVVMLVSLFSTAQKSFEGKVTYSVQFSGEGAEMMSAFMFSGYEYYFAENRARLTMTGGMAYMFGAFIVNSATKKSYLLKLDEKIAYDMSSEDDDEATTESNIVGEITKLDETEEILGYNCSKYKFSMVEDSSTVVMYYWVTNEIAPGSHKKLGTGNSLFIEGMNGFPLKIVSEIEGIVITQVATEIVQEKLDDALFEVPAGYLVKDFSESPLGMFID